MKRSERLARHYLRAADLRAIFLAGSGRRLRLGITRDPAAKVRDLKRARATLHCVYWLGSSEAARKVIAAACAAMPGLDRGIIGSAPTVKAAVVNAAKAAAVTLTDDATVQARAAAVAADIEDRVKAMQSSGQLRGLNAEYRAAREEAAKRGVAILSYGDYLERYKIRLLYQIAGLADGRQR